MAVEVTAMLKSIRIISVSDWKRFTPVTIYGSSFLALYLLVVRALRYRRLRALHRDYAKIQSNLTPLQAQKILHLPLFLDMPFVTGRSLEFALFKTYGIPTISHLLNKTGQLAKAETNSRRYVDTGLLINSWISCPLSGPGSGAPETTADNEVDPRSAIAVARTNWLHGHYQISNDDFLYTLSVFIYEPVRWAEKFGWRSYSRLECEASYTFWAEIGRRMGIENIPPSYDTFLDWSEAHERDYMVPNEDNAVVANYTVELIVRKIPNVLGLKSLGRRIVICLLGDRLRKAMMLPEQPRFLVKMVEGLLLFHSFFCRNLCLPRSTPYHYVHPNPKLEDKEDGKLPRAYPEYYRNDPWYYPESTGVEKLWEKIQIAIGLAGPKDFPGPHFRSEGYRLEELGPTYFAKSEHSKVMKMAEKIQGKPVTGPWSLDYKGGCPMAAS